MRCLLDGQTTRFLSLFSSSRYHNFVHVSLGHNSVLFWGFYNGGSQEMALVATSSQTPAAVLLFPAVSVLLKVQLWVQFDEFRGGESSQGSEKFWHQGFQTQTPLWSKTGLPVGRRPWIPGRRASLILSHQKGQSPNWPVALDACSPRLLLHSLFFWFLLLLLFLVFKYFLLEIACEFKQVSLRQTDKLNSKYSQQAWSLICGITCLQS